MRTPCSPSCPVGSKPRGSRESSGSKAESCGSKLAKGPSPSKWRHQLPPLPFAKLSLTLKCNRMGKPRSPSCRVSWSLAQPLEPVRSGLRPSAMGSAARNVPRRGRRRKGNRPCDWSPPLDWWVLERFQRFLAFPLILVFADQALRVKALECPEFGFQPGFLIAWDLVDHDLDHTRKGRLGQGPS